MLERNPHGTYPENKKPLTVRQTENYECVTKRFTFELGW